MKVSSILTIIVAMSSLSLSACNMHAEAQPREEPHKIVVTSPEAKDVVITQQYVCQIRSRKHINVKALQSGYLEAIHIKEGQAVKTDDVMFQIVPTLYKARLEAELAEARLAKLKLKYTQKLADDKVVSIQEVALLQAEFDKAQAKADLAKAELNFATVKAPFDGIIDRLNEQHGSLIKEGDVLTTLSDNSVMWVYFNVPEARYLEDMASMGHDMDSRHIELVLANGAKFPQACESVRREAKFNNETGNLAYRADFPNPDGLLRHGQTGNILIHRPLKEAIVIPQRATFEVLDKRYVYIVDKDDVVHQREIDVLHEMDDIFVIKKEEIKKEGHKAEGLKKEIHKGINVNDRIILEGVRQVHEGEKVEYEFLKSEAALANQKQHAE